MGLSCHRQLQLKKESYKYDWFILVALYTCFFFSEVEADVLHNEILLGAKPKMSRKNESETSTYP